MRLSDEEIERLMQALEPVRKQAYDEGFKFGEKQGAASVYYELLRRIEAAMHEGKAEEEAAASKSIRDWIKKTWPDVNR